MEIKARLRKPCTEEARIEFIVENNHQKGYEIRETEEAYEAWGKTDAEILEIKRAVKLDENTSKAGEAIDKGYVVFKEAQFETNSQTSGDLGDKRNLCILRGETSTEWLSRDDKVVEMAIDTVNPAENDDFVKLGFLVEDYKGVVWTVKYMGYKQQILAATTAEEIDAIVIDYNVPTILAAINAEEEVEE